MASTGQVATAQADAFRTVHPLEYHLKFLEQGVRPDGRAFLRARKAHANVRQISSADGSAMVRLGDTVVVAGVQCEPCVPSEAEPGRGRISVSLEIAATSALATRGGNAGACGGGGGGSHRRELEREHAAVGELLQRAATGGLVDLEGLVIEAGRAVWSCHCSVYVLEHAGNVVDAALLATLCALRDARLPALRLEEAEEGRQARVVATEEVPLPLPLGRPLFAVTFGLLGEHLLLDPTREEEALLSASFSVFIDDEGNFSALHKPGGAPLSDEHFKAALSAAQDRLPALRKLCAAAATAAHGMS